MNGTLRDTTATADDDLAPKRQNGFAIRAFRDKEGLSQTELAALARIRQPTLSDIETEKADARLATLNLIARALCIPVAAIVRVADVPAVAGPAVDAAASEPAA